MLCSASSSFEDFSMMLSNFDACGMVLSLFLWFFIHFIGSLLIYIIYAILSHSFWLDEGYAEYKASSTDPKNSFEIVIKVLKHKTDKEWKRGKMSWKEVRMKMMWKVIKARPSYSSQMPYMFFSLHPNSLTFTVSRRHHMMLCYRQRCGCGSM